MTGLYVRDVGRGDSRRGCGDGQICQRRSRGRGIVVDGGSRRRIDRAEGPNDSVIKTWTYDVSDVAIKSQMS